MVLWLRLYTTTDCIPHLTTAAAAIAVVVIVAVVAVAVAIAFAVAVAVAVALTIAVTIAVATAIVVTVAVVVIDSIASVHDPFATTIVMSLLPPAVAVAVADAITTFS